MVLMVQSKKQLVERDNLPDVVPTEYPREGVTLKRGSRWQPIGFKTVADATIQALDNAGFTVESEGWAVTNTARKGPDKGMPMGLLGFLTVDHPDLNAPKDTKYSFGLRHSNNMAHALSVVAGLNVLICTNGSAIGERVLNKKHTTGLNLLSLLDDGVKAWTEVATTAESMIESFKNYDLSGDTGIRQGIELLTEMVSPRVVGKEPVLPTKYLSNVVDEWRWPRYNEWKEERNLWGLSQAVTEIAKARRVEGQLETFNRLRNFCDLKVAAQLN